MIQADGTVPLWAAGLLSLAGAILINWFSDASFPLAKGAFFRFGETWQQYRQRRADRSAALAHQTLDRPEFALGAGLWDFAWSFMAAVFWLATKATPASAGAMVPINALLELGLMLCFAWNIAAAIIWFQRFSDPRGYAERTLARLRKKGFLRDDE